MKGDTLETNKGFCKILWPLLTLLAVNATFTSCNEEKTKVKPLVYTISIEMGEITKDSASSVIRLYEERDSGDVCISSWVNGLMWDEKGSPTKITLIEILHEKEKDSIIVKDDKFFTNDNAENY